MNEFKIAKNGILLLVLGSALVFVEPVGATDVACAAPQTLAAAVVGAGNGCKYLNANFLGFNVSTETGSEGSVGGTYPTPVTGASANVEFTASGTPTYSLAYQTTGQETAGAGTCVANSWCVHGNSANALQVITDDATMTTGRIFGLTLSDGTVGSPGAMRAGDTITVREQYCVGGASIATCTAADLGFLQIVQTTTATGFSGAPVITICQATLTGGACTSTAAATAAISISGGSNNITIADNITLTTVGNEANDIFINGFSNGFNTTPEPSTFILLGSALAGIAGFGLRRRKFRS